MSTAPHHPTLAAVMTRDVATLRAGDTVDLAGNLMRAARIRHLPVIDGDARVVGLVTHRDLLAATIEHTAEMGAPERASYLRNLPVDRIMRTDVRTVAIDTRLTDAADIIVKNKYGCLPVVDREGRLAGLVTEHDFVLLTIRLLGHDDA